MRGLRAGSQSPAMRDGSPTNDHGVKVCHPTVLNLVWRRTTVLILLMLLQSMSQFILESYEKLVSEHVIIPLFLTMLVGAGGNAGNQAAVHSITGLVTGEISIRNFRAVMLKEAVVGLLCASILSCTCMARVYLFYDADDKFGDSYAVLCVIAICSSLFLIVLTSVVVGSALPFMFEAIGVNREHAAPVIQVIMDITGVFITCHISHAMLTDAKPIAVIPTKGEGNSF
ncbi:Magnesium transporter MgtE [Diplonema papillatum]|nr:Magnesium transporter MgtE [Diplonema papillatum]